MSWEAWWLLPVSILAAGLSGWAAQTAWNRLLRHRLGREAARLGLEYVPGSPREPLRQWPFLHALEDDGLRVEATFEGESATILAVRHVEGPVTLVALPRGHPPPPGAGLWVRDHGEWTLWGICDAPNADVLARLLDVLPENN